jgi:hypothetical protein
MPTAAYIAANAHNDDEHMAKLQALALKGVWVLQTARTDKPARDPAPTRHTGMMQRHQNQLAAPAIAPRPHGVQLINGELRHALIQNRVELSCAQRRALNTYGGNEPTTLDVNDDELYGAECFSIYICTTPLPKGLKISVSITKFNGQQDPRIWLDDFLTAITVIGGSRDNAMQLLQLHLRDSA